MLLEFSVENYLSFKNKVSFSMITANIRELEESNTFLEGENTLLKSAVIYGANASGKSNLLKAFSFARRMVLNSSKETQAEEEIKVEPFRLNTESEGDPSYFEIIFLYQGTKYRYGFLADRLRIHAEWLFYVPKRNEAALFLRDEREIQVKAGFKEAKGLEHRTRNNALFLSVAAQFNVEIAQDILNWFRQFNLISGLEDKSYYSITLKRLESKKFRHRILEFLKVADLGIHDIHQRDVADISSENLPTNIPDPLRQAFQLMLSDESISIKEFSLTALHRKFDDKGNFDSYEEFDFVRNESQGTQKIFSMAGPVLDTLEKGKILVIDELDARLHPLITRFLIDLFHDSTTNPKHAQLIFATHDTQLLKRDCFRRDQIWFTEKDEYGSTDLYSLAEYKESNKKIRNDASYMKDYILGKYGAIPFIGGPEGIFGDELYEE